MADDSLRILPSRQGADRPRDHAVSEDMIRTLVHTFYGRVRDDEALGPIFAAELGDDWGPHLDKMCDFWSSVMLTTGRYKGRPLPAHMKVEAIREEHFARWLALFSETAREVCPPREADAFIARASRIAESFKLAMFFRLPPAGAPPRPSDPSR
ncbi:group III truncated hemoglobin [Kaustia mangrovi]|nr:group III truncated hemoglobin [Kaustia mangrovi]